MHANCLPCSCQNQARLHAANIDSRGDNHSRFSGFLNVKAKNLGLQLTQLGLGVEQLHSRGRVRPNHVPHVVLAEWQCEASAQMEL